MSRSQFTTYKKTKGTQTLQCSRCKTLNKYGAGEMLVLDGNEFIGKCCASAHQTKMAVALKNPPASALKMHPVPGAAEKYDGPTPKTLMENRR